jgi:hypothetical protein
MDGICSRGAGCLLATGEASSAPTTARSSLDQNEDSTGEMVTTSGRRGAPRAPASQWQHDQTGVPVRHHGSKGAGQLDGL